MAGWDDAHFLDVAILHPFRHADADDLAVMGFREGAAHRHLEPAAPDVDGIRRQREAEQTAPLTIVRNPDLLVIAAFLLQFQEGEERLEAAVGHLQRLLCHARLQEPVVFVGLAELVVLLVWKIAFATEELLSDVVDRDIVQVVAVATHFCQHGIFLFAEMPDIV